MAKVEERLKELGLEIPTAAPPAANYAPYCFTGNHLYISGQLPLKDGEATHKGKLGQDHEVEAGQEAARQCGINAIAQTKAALGDLDRVTRVVKLTGFVNSAPDFIYQPHVVNGVSNLMGEVFGEAGVHSRSAVGAGALPFNVAVEVEAIIEFR